MAEHPGVTVHGRFQPPLHIHHWAYVRKGFELAERVDVLITNPYLNEGVEPTASWRNAPQNNPFTFDERVFMFDAFFRATDIDRKRYRFMPFNIKSSNAFHELNPAIPNTVNLYSTWSRKKAALFEDHGLYVIRLANVEVVPASGTEIRGLIKAHFGNLDELTIKLIDANFMPEAVPGLVEVLDKRGVSGRPLTFDDLSPDLPKLVKS